ncbi:MAG: HAMP domain-containing protein [Alphaproteobacteria bacterium]|nr:HAMP domain-containing protein [Alphaproteobacteria bacterium]
MPRRRLRDFMPKGLYWRTLLIIVAPAAILQLIITLVFLDDHWQATSKRMSQGVASDVALIIQLYERDPRPETFADLQQLAWQPLRLRIDIEPGAALEDARCRSAGSTLDRYLTRALREELSRDVWYESSCAGVDVRIRVPTAEGILDVRAFRDRVQARSGPLFVAWIIGATAFLGILSIIFIRNQVRPIEMLADAMDRFGRGQDVSLYKARGAREVRQATHAFFAMRARIKRHIDQRAQLLAGVSHDLRTPLTRLKLQFALMPPAPEIDEAKRDIEEMNDTLAEYLAFAKGQWTEEPQPADIGAIVEDVVAGAQRSGAQIEVARAGDLHAPVRARALKRCIVNLVDNAAAHGDHVRIEALRDAAAICVIVDDDGPGIPEDQYEDAFRPFSRLDETRSRNAKGVGLGLAIARDVARSHGGDVVLSRAPMGGLRATLRLPV